MLKNQNKAFIIISIFSFLFTSNNSAFINNCVVNFDDVKLENNNIVLEGQYKNLNIPELQISEDFKGSKSLIKVILDTPTEVDNFDMPRPTADSTIEESQLYLTQYRNYVQNIIFKNNVAKIKEIEKTSRLDNFVPSNIFSMVTCEINNSDINDVLFDNLNNLYTIKEVDSVYISEASTLTNTFTDYSMNDVYNYTNLSNAINNRQYSGKGVNFGIIDAGILNLSKYSGNLSTNNDYTGRNIYIRNTNRPYDDHSDHVAMLSVGNNGIAPETNIYSTTYEDSFESNVKWMIDNGVNIVNTSYGNYSSSNNGAYTSEAKIADQLVRNYLLNLVGSAGNKRSDLNPLNEISSPKTAYNYITVGNTSQSNSFVSSTSSYVEKNSYGGSKPNLVAPGFTKTNSYNGKYSDGTSFASPLVAGSLALLMEEFPYLVAFPDLCISILTSSATPLDGTYHVSSGDSKYDSSGLHNMFGSGMLNYEKMREAANNCLALSRTKGSQTGFLNKTLDFEAKVNTRVRASLAWLATGGNNSFTDYDLYLSRVHPDGSTSVLKRVIGSTNNVEFLDYKFVASGKFRLSIDQHTVNNQNDYIGLSYTIMDDIVGSESGGTEYVDRTSASVMLTTASYDFDGVYNFTEISKTLNITPYYSIDTKRLRTAIIDGYLVMSAKRNNAGIAYLEYDLNQYLTGLNFQLALWSADESLIKNSYIALEYKDSNGSWKPAMTFNAKEMGQNKDTLIDYSVIFQELTSQIRFIVTTNDVMNENNRGRVVIGNVNFVA